MQRLLVVFIFIISNTCYSQVTPRNILGDKYSLNAINDLLFSQEEFKPYPTTTKEWYNKVPDSVLNKLIKEGENALKYKFEPISATLSLRFVRDGDRSEHAAISFTKRAMLKDLIIAESIEDKGRFTEAIINGIWSICEESFWGVPAHIPNTGLPDVDHPVVELFSAETATVLALSDYLVGNKLDEINPLLRKRIYTEINKRIFIPMLNTSANYGWMSKTTPVNNWNPWINSNWIMTTLLLEKDKTQRSLMIHNAMLGLDLYLNGLGDEAGCDEGPSYWFAAAGCFFDSLEFLNEASNGKITIYDHPFIKKMASYIYKTYIDGQYFVNFSDADPKITPDGLLLYRIGKAINDPYLMQMGQYAFSKFGNLKYQTPHSNDNFQKARYLENILTVSKIGVLNSGFNPLKNVWVNDVQLLAARSTNGLYLATHGGHNAEHHNHNDVGDFIVYANGDPLIIDVGRGNYTARTFSPNRYELWFTQSQYHNLPIVNGLGEMAGRAYAAKNVNHITTEKNSLLSMDISSAYNKSAAIKKWVRTVSLNKIKNQVELRDNYELSESPTSLQQVFMTVCKTDLNQAGKILLTTFSQEKYTINYDDKLWIAAVELPSTEGVEYSSLKTKWDGYPIKRIILTQKNPISKNDTKFVIKKY